MGLAQKTSARPPRRRSSGQMHVVVVPKEAESGVRLSGSGSSANDAQPASDVDDLRTIASASMAAAMGFEVCARRATEIDVAERMAAIAGDAKRLAEDVSALVPGGVRKPSTSERLRWEWLASTAALLDGGAQGRVADEAERHLAIAAAAASNVADSELVRRVERLAALGRSASRTSA